MKKLPNEIYNNIAKANILSYMPYGYSDFSTDCKIFIKALEAGRLISIERRKGRYGVNMSIRSYEGTMKRGYYKCYTSMLISLGFEAVIRNADDFIRLPEDYLIRLPEDGDAILTKIYKLGLISEKRYKKLKGKQNETI